MNARHARHARYDRSTHYMLAVLLASACCACKSVTTTPRTEVLLKMDADAPVRERADELKVELSSGSIDAAQLTVTQPELFDRTSEAFHWPATLALIALPGHETNQFAVTITALRDGNALARGRVQSSFLRDQTLELRTAVFGGCLSKLDCGDDQTCVVQGGQATCVSAAVDPHDLPKFTPGDAVGSAADGGSMTDAGAPSVPIDAGSTHYGNADACTSHSEICDNGVDDDCNGVADCADPACTAMTCAPSTGVVGVLVPVESPCPSDYSGGVDLIYQGLVSTGCGGCGCSTQAVQCEPHVYFYADAEACTNDVAPFSQGKLLSTSLTYACSPGAIGDNDGIGSPKGWRVAMEMIGGTCSASGSSTLNPPQWTMTRKLCKATSTAAGCADGQTCMPKSSGSQVCIEATNKQCPASTTLQTWNHGYADTRHCGQCTCSTTTGACDAVSVELGSDWTCGTIDDTLHDGQKNCALAGSEPYAIVTGSSSIGCTTSAQTLGSLAATDPLDLCCGAQ